MARTAITVTMLSRAGVVQPATQASDQTNGMQINGNDGRIILEVKNNNAGTQTVGVSFSPSKTVDGVTPADKTVSFTAGQTKVLGPFPPALYNQPGNMVFVNPSVNTDLAIRAYQLPSN